MTIQELQAFIDTKPDLRQLINVIADYMQANPGGGGGNTIYIANDTLASDRTVNLNGKFLQFLEGGNIFLRIDPFQFSSRIVATDGTASSLLTLNGNSGGPSADWDLFATDGTNSVDIFGDAITKTLTHTADTHTFNGKIINPDIVAKDFANDAAAAAGGVEIGEDYHTAGVKKVRII